VVTLIPMFCDCRLSLRMATLRSGATKDFVDKLKLDVNYFRRYVNNFADDDQLLNTAVSFPIAFRKAYIYGAEAKLNLSAVHRFSGSSATPTRSAASTSVTRRPLPGQRCQQRPDQHQRPPMGSQDQRHTLQLASATNWSTACGLRLERQYGSDSPRNLTRPTKTRSPTPSHNTDRPL